MNELRTAVTVLAAILGTSVAVAVAFGIFKSKRWRKKGAESRLSEMDEMKKRTEELEQRGQNMNWHRFFSNTPTTTTTTTDDFHSQYRT